MCIKKVPIVIFFSFFNSIDSYSQIQWDSSLSITWSNFKGKPLNRMSEFKATTLSFVESEYGSHDTCFFYNVRTLFDEIKSWYVDTTNELLEHERGHFNISEIYARKIRKFLKINLRKGVPDDEIRKGIDELLKLKVKYQDLYDKETNYSQNLFKQKCWELKIAKQLKELDDYHICEYNNCSNSFE